MLRKHQYIKQIQADVIETKLGGTRDSTPSFVPSILEHRMQTPGPKDTALKWLFFFHIKTQFPLDCHYKIRDTLFSKQIDINMKKYHT